MNQRLQNILNEQYLYLRALIDLGPVLAILSTVISPIAMDFIAAHESGSDDQFAALITEIMANDLYFHLTNALFETKQMVLFEALNPLQDWGGLMYVPCQPYRFIFELSCKTEAWLGINGRDRAGRAILEFSQDCGRTIATLGTSQVEVLTGLFMECQKPLHKDKLLIFSGY